jgi:ABC-2 type transport system permease protein
MTVHISRLDLRLRRRLIIGYAVGMAAYAMIVIGLYPMFKDQTSLNALTEDSPATTAVLGNVTITSPAGWVNANLYSYFVPLIQLLVTIGYGGSCIAGQDENRTLGLVASLPLTRRAIAIEKVIALFVQALVVPIVVALCALAGRGFELTIAHGPLFGITAGVFLLGMFFGSLAMLVGAVTGSRGIALGVTSATAAAAYLISALAPLIDWLGPTRYISPFFYAVDDNQIEHGLPLTYAGILGTAILILATSAVVAFDRLDLH